ncbi:hypothetical protein Zmor_022813 [Zophobas morio]|uniref:Uncharacterized protein n=1 Tax=Zophobas morio TaxID=2755281 RepID=A0AA38M6E6_9CUCU|nr:hypothetical protein Zmor_022813 [Zophobas morio]
MPRNRPLRNGKTAPSGPRSPPPAARGRPPPRQRRGRVPRWAHGGDKGWMGASSPPPVKINKLHGVKWQPGAAHKQRKSSKAVKGGGSGLTFEIMRVRNAVNYALTLCWTRITSSFSQKCTQYNAVFELLSVTAGHSDRRTLDACFARRPFNNKGALRSQCAI